MKKFLLLFSTVFMLMICFCVPSFAASSGSWTVIHDGFFKQSGWEFNQDFFGFTADGNILSLADGKRYRITVANEYVFVGDCVYSSSSSTYTVNAFDEVNDYSLTLTYYADSDYTMLFSDFTFSFMAKGTIEVFEEASSESIVDSVTSGVGSAVSWVSTFADTIMTNPLLFFAAILTLFGFGIGLFKRLRT